METKSDGVDRKIPNNNSFDIIEDVEKHTDWVLQRLVALANIADYQVNIILNIHGLIISGRLISGWRYFDELVELSLKNVTENKQRNEIIGFYKVFSSAYDEMKERIDNNKEPNDVDYHPLYVHLNHQIKVFYGEED